MRWLRILTVVIFTLFIASGVAAYLFTRHITVLGINNLAAGEISKLLGNKVVIGNIRLADFRTIEIDDVSLDENSGLPMLQVPRVSVKFSPFGIFSGMKPDDFLSSITVCDAKVFIVEKKLNVWNLEEIAQNVPKSPQKTALQFKPEIRIVNATVAASFFSGARNIADKVTGILDLSQPDMVRFKANVGSAFGTSVRGSGYFDLSNDKLALTLHTNRIGLAEGGTLFFWKDIPNLDVKLKSGYANNLDVYVTVFTKKKQDNVKFTVLGDCIDAGADIFGVSVEHAWGRLMVCEKKVSIANGRASAFGDSVNVSGDFVFAPKDYRDYELNITFAGKNLHPAVVNRFIPGIVPVDCAVDVAGYTYGKLGKLTAEADVESRNVSAFGYHADKVQAKAALIDGKEIVISDGIVGAYSGAARFSGFYNIEKGAYQLNAAGSNVDCATVPALSEYGLRAKVSFSAIIGGDKADYVRTASGNFAAQAISYDKYSADSAVCGFSYNEKKMVVDYLNIGAYGGQTSVYGTIGTGVNIKARAVGIDGARVANVFSLKKMSGAVDAAIDVTGTPGRPYIKIHAEAVNGNVSVQKFKNAHVEADYLDGQLNVSNFEAYDSSGGFASASGIFDFNDSSLRLQGQLSDVQVRDVVSAVSADSKVLGAANGTFEIDGSFSDPVLEADLSSPCIVLNGYLAKDVSGKIDLTKYGMVLRSLNLSMLGGKLIAEGTMNDYSDLDFLVKINNMDIEKLPQEMINRNISGSVAARVFLKGTLNEPMLFGKIDSPALVYHQQTYSDVWAEFSVNKEMLDINQGGFKHKLGVAKFDGSIQLNDFVCAGNIEMNNMDIADLAVTAGARDSDALQGQLNLNAEFSGTLDNPSLKINAKAPVISSYGMALDNFAADCYYVDKVLTVSNLFAKRGDSLLAGKGTIEIDGPLNMEVGARNIDVSIIPKWAGMDMPLGGNLSATAQIGGTYANPDVALSLSVDKPVYKGILLDEIFGLFTVNRDKITIGQVLFSKSGYKAVLTGSMPYAAFDMHEAPTAMRALDQMNLKFSLDKADLGILPSMFSKQVSSAKGSLSANMSVTGSLGAPQVNGQIALDNGMIVVNSLKDRIEDVNVRLTVNNNLLRIEKAHGQIDKGNVDISGGGVIYGWKLRNYSFSAKSKDLSINTKQFYIPLDLDLKLDDASGRAKVSGAVSFRDEDVFEVKGLLSLLSTDGDSSESIVPNIDYDLSLNFGDKLRVYNPVLFDMVVGGSLHVGGTTLQPDIKGTVRAKRGIVMYLRNEFTVDYADVSYDEKNTYWPRIDLQGKTTIRTPDPVNPTTSLPKEYLVILTVKGSANNPQIKLESTGLSQSDVSSLLNFGQIIQTSEYSGAQSQSAANVQANMMTGAIQMVALGSVESSVRTNLGLDTFRLTRGVLNVSSGTNNNSNNINSQEIYQLEIGKYLIDKLLLKSTIGIGYNYYQLMFQYDMWQQLYLSGSIDDQQNGSLSINKIWRFY